MLFAKKEEAPLVAHYLNNLIQESGARTQISAVVGTKRLAIVSQSKQTVKRSLWRLPVTVEFRRWFWYGDFGDWFPDEDHHLELIICA